LAERQTCVPDFELPGSGWNARDSKAAFVIREGNIWSLENDDVAKRFGVA